MSTGILVANREILRRSLLEAILQNKPDQVRELRAAIARLNAEMQAKNQAAERQYEQDLQAAGHD